MLQIAEKKRVTAKKLRNIDRPRRLDSRSMTVLVLLCRLTHCRDTRMPGYGSCCRHPAILGGQDRHTQNNPSQVVTCHWHLLLQERGVPNDTPGLSFDALAMSNLDYGNDFGSLGGCEIFGASEQPVRIKVPHSPTDKTISQVFQMIIR